MLSTIGFDDRARQTSNQHRETQIRRQGSATNRDPRPGLDAAERQPLKPAFVIVALLADGRHQLSPLALLLFPERSSLGDRCVVKITQEGIPKRLVHVRWNRNLRHNAQRVKVKEDGTCVMRIAATSNCRWNFDRARSADHRPYRFRANLGRGIRRLGDETTPAGASFDRRDQKPSLGVDGSGCHDFGAGTWAADLERQYFV